MDNRKKVIIVDDAPHIRQLVRLTLLDFDVDTFDAANVRDALEILDQTQMDLIITDLYMPELTGFDLVREVRKIESYKYTPVIVLTAESSKNIAEQGRDLGVSAWVVKPFDPQVIEKALRKILNIEKFDPTDINRFLSRMAESKNKK